MRSNCGSGGPVLSYPGAMMALCRRPLRLTRRWCVGDARLEVLFDELAELAGQRNAIDGRIVEIVAELDRDELCGCYGCAVGGGVGGLEVGLVVGKREDDRHRRAPAGGVSPLRAGMREGRLSLDQVGVIAERAAEGRMSIMRSWPPVATVVSVAHRGEAGTATRTRTRSRSAGLDHQDLLRREVHHYRITLPHLEAAKFDAALASHREALVAEWKRDHETAPSGSGQRPPLPNTGDAFLRLVEAGWDAEAAARPHGQHTTVVVHLDVKEHDRPLASGAAAVRRRSPLPDL